MDESDLDKSYEAHCKFISCVSPTLKTVVIVPPIPTLFEGSVNRLGLLEPQKLGHISSITFSIVQDVKVGRDVLPWLVAFLSGLPNPEILRDITLLCELWGIIPETDTFSLGEWRELDSPLIRFPNLQRVHLECHNNEFNANQPRAIACTVWFRSQLPMLNEKGILSIKFSAHRWFGGDFVARELEREFLD
ncbi:hypothetical protein BDN72DRAFT_525054 [Pluteus cervinus]|uniref:Uncharacterized protein n=1 Tax=Pluteus cervinus TaxID=181527 RepID=A0ACD3AY53_9AGAR|nr:hypothetical protein BDN72DRAFT_525054 [Pluteus cervinus]